MLDRTPVVPAIMVSLLLLFVGLLFPANAAAATCPGATQTCATVENEAALVASISAPPFVFTSGYANDGDGGGGVLYELNGTSCSSNGGTVIQDSNTPKNCYYAQTFPQNVMQWGAKCDATNPSMPGVVAGGSYTFVAPVTLSTPKLPKPGAFIAITDAGSSGGTLATTLSMPGASKLNGSATAAMFLAGARTLTVSSASGILAGELITGTGIASNTIVVAYNSMSGAVTLSIPTSGATMSSETVMFTGTEFPLTTPASMPVPLWVPSDANVATSGSGYHVGQAVTLTDRTVLVVITVDGSGDITEARILTQASDTSIPANPVADSGNSATTFTMTYSPTGQYWYGDDDRASIQNALTAAASANNGAAAPGLDVYLPANMACAALEPHSRSAAPLSACCCPTASTACAVTGRTRAASSRWPAWAI